MAPYSAGAPTSSASLATALSRATWSLWTWGANDFGQLGASTIFFCPPVGLNTRCSGSAIQVGSFDASGVASKWVESIAAGDKHTLVRTMDGAVRAWGANDRGQLGATTSITCAGTPCSQVPLQVTGAIGSGALSGARAIAAGGALSLALAQPSAAVSPSSLTFGSQTFDSTSAVKTVTLSNSGSVDLSIPNTSVSGEFQRVHMSAAGACATTLGAGKTCSIDVVFKPLMGAYGAGSRTGTLTTTTMVRMDRRVWRWPAAR
jgi:hypothetical protein